LNVYGYIRNLSMGFKKYCKFFSPFYFPLCEKLFYGVSVICFRMMYTFSGFDAIPIAVTESAVWKYE